MDPVRTAKLAVAAAFVTAAGSSCTAATDGQTVVAASAASSPPVVAKRSVANCQMLPPPSRVPEAKRQGWIAESRYRAAREPVEEILANRFGLSDKTSAQLDRGYLGTALDYDRREMVIVLDPALVRDPATLQDDLKRAGAQRHTADADVPVLEVRVQTTCVPVRDLKDAKDLIRAQDWHPDAKGAVSSYGLDPGASAIRVTIRGSNAEDVGKELERRLGPAVVVEAG